MADRLYGSAILGIAAEVRALVARGTPVCNLTVGDFAPSEFRIPAGLERRIGEALARGETNYPPSNGLPQLRETVAALYRERLGLAVDPLQVIVCGGSRPAIYATYSCLVDPGDRVVYAAPSWNNDSYVVMSGAEPVVVDCDASTRFLPTADSLRDAVRGARLLALNSPLNPAGTAIERGALLGVCEAILTENEARGRRGERPLYLMYDQIYWMLRSAGTEHVTPPELLPEMARYTIFVDGISKAFAATGLRVGWTVGPVDLIARMSAVLGHVGAWAPRAEQVATVDLLDDPAAIRAFHAGFLRGIGERLDLLHGGLQAMKQRGLPVDCLPPAGAIYLAARISPFGRHTPAGATLRTNEEVRRYLLEAAGIGVVPFQAFGVPEDSGWFRLSVGAVSTAEIEAALPRLADALASLR